MTVQLRDEEAHVLAAITEGSVELSASLPAIGDPDFPYLGLIDPYSDTWFSSLQMRAVLPELRRLRDRLPSPPHVLQELEELADRCADGIGLYIVFLGD